MGLKKEEIQRREEHAKMLYLNEHLTFEEIADRVGLSRQTVGKTANEEKWKEMKVCLTLTREEQIKNWHRQIAEINRNIANREEGQRYPTPAKPIRSSSCRVLSKKMETEAGIAEIISVGSRFALWLRAVDNDEARKFVERFDAFIKERL